MSKIVRVDLGCGKRKPKGYIGIDIRKFKGVDYVLDLGKDPLPFKNDSVDIIRALHLFEHFYPHELFHCIEECWRVLKPKGHIHIEVPKAGTHAYYINPDHKIQFVEDTFGFFQVPGNSERIDPHGYLKGFWHVCVLETPHKEHILVDMYPNKRNGRFDYVEVAIDRVVKSS